MKKKFYADAIAKLQDRYEAGTITLEEMRDMAQDYVDATRTGSEEFNNSVYGRGVKVEVEMRERSNCDWYYNIPDELADTMPMEMFMGMFNVQKDPENGNSLVHIMRMGENGGLLGYLMSATDLIAKIEEHRETFCFSGSIATGLEHGLCLTDDEGVFFIETIPKRLKYFYDSADKLLTQKYGDEWLNKKAKDKSEEGD